jgi:fluoride exporter
VSVDVALSSLSARRLAVISILVGGAAGALARAGLSAAFPPHDGSWPWGTFTANLAGALLLGWLITRLTERIAPTRFWRPLIGTGLAGALTTFSAFSIETIRIGKGGNPALAVAYPAVSIVLGMVCAVAGTMVARWGRHW